MKKGVLIVLGMLMIASSVEAKKSENLPNRFGVNYYAYNNAVNFFENGIEFFVFTNGDFDFDINFTNRRLPIDRDFRGRITRIGNVSLRYDFRGNVTRIGGISMGYFRDRLTRVGNLRVSYNRWGDPIFNGNVRNFYYNNGVRFNLSFGDVCNYNDPYFFRNEFRRNYSQIREDNNFFYYRANTNANIGNRSQILRRRKPATLRNSNSNISRRSANNTYRKNEINKRTSSNSNTRSSLRITIPKKETKRNTVISNSSVLNQKRMMNTSRNNVGISRKINSNDNKSELKKRAEKTERKKRS